MSDWNNFLDMIRDMKEHVKNNNSSIVQEDLPLELKWNYRCIKTDKTWSIKISDIRKNITELTNNGNSENIHAELSNNKAAVLKLVAAHESSKSLLLKLINET